MKKKEKSTQSQINNGFSNLMGSYIEALKENSGDIVQALELLQGKNLSAFDKKELKSIQKHLKEIDKNLKDIGE